MTTISVRLSAEDKRALDAIRKATGKSASDVVREALHEKRKRVGGRKRERDTSFADAYRVPMAQLPDDPVEPVTDDASNVSARVRAIIEAKWRAGRL